MIAWKKLIASSTRFRQESQNFLCRHSSSSQHSHWNAVLHTDGSEEDFAEDFEESGTSYDQATAHNVEWTDFDEANLDAAHFDTFTHTSDAS